MQPAEKRRSLRRAISYPAYLDLGDGSPPRECTLCDASQEGAQLVVANPDGLPDLFVLALSADGAARRQCRVVWRTKNQIGVEFLKPPKPKKGHKPVPAYMQQFFPPAAEEAAEPAGSVDNPPLPKS
jgi:hypothetical protein